MKWFLNSKLKVTVEYKHKVKDDSPFDEVQNKNSFYMNIVKPKLDAISISTNIESIIDIDINEWQNFRSYPNWNVNLHYKDVGSPHIFWAQQRIGN